MCEPGRSINTADVLGAGPKHSHFWITVYNFINKHYISIIEKVKRTLKLETQEAKVCTTVYGQEATGAKPGGLTPKPVCSGKAESRPRRAMSMFIFFYP